MPYGETAGLESEMSPGGVCLHEFLRLRFLAQTEWNGAASGLCIFCTYLISNNSRRLRFVTGAPLGHRGQTVYSI